MPRKMPARLFTIHSRKGIGGRPRGAPTAVVGWKAHLCENAR